MYMLKDKFKIDAKKRFKESIANSSIKTCKQGKNKTKKLLLSTVFLINRNYCKSQIVTFKCQHKKITKLIGKN